jgi:hypothetical protein
MVFKNLNFDRDQFWPRSDSDESFKLFFNSTGVYASPGMTTHIAIKRTFSYKMPYPYSDCQANINENRSPYVQKILSMNSTYMQTTCFELCFRQYVLDKCGCEDLSSRFSGDDKSVPPCINSAQFICDHKNYNHFYQNLLTEMCIDSNLCPLECEEIDYSATVSSTSFPTPGYYEFLKTHPVVLKHFENNSSAITYETLKAVALHVNVYYGSLSYTEITESPQMDMLCLVFYIFCNQLF